MCRGDQSTSSKTERRVNIFAGSMLPLQAYMPVQRVPFLVHTLQRQLVCMN